LDSFKIHILRARPKPDKGVKCPRVIPGVGKCPTPPLPSSNKISNFKCWGEGGDGHCWN